MNPEEFEAYWTDCLAQKQYAIYEYDPETGRQGDEIGLIGGHSPEQAESKMAQYLEVDHTTLHAERAWPDSEC